jgi:hypothetical protein
VPLEPAQESPPGRRGTARKRFHCDAEVSGEDAHSEQMFAPNCLATEFGQYRELHKSAVVQAPQEIRNLST